MDSKFIQLKKSVIRLQVSYNTLFIFIVNVIL